MKKTVKTVYLEDLKFEETRPGLRHVLLFGEDRPTKYVRSGIFILEPGAELDMHYHNIEEEQHVIHGYATLIDAEKKRYELGPGTTFFCPAGPNGAHGIKNTSDIPFICLYMYPSPEGKPPLRTPVST